jgi:hypothetical protein
MPAQRIVLRAYYNMPNLLRPFPCIARQKEICRTDASFTDFEYFLVPTMDFRQAILKEGNELEVIEPQALREMIHDELKATIKLY